MPDVLSPRHYRFLVNLRDHGRSLYVRGANPGLMERLGLDVVRREEERRRGCR